MKKKIAQILVGVFLIATPFLTFAQANQPTYNSASSSGVSLWPLLISLAVIVFVIGVIKYIAGADDSAKRTEGRNFMIYGLVALFVMVSVWGLVGVLQGTFGLGNSPVIPQLQDL